MRDSVGMFDASTLGKIEVVGPDAAEFMNRLYINNWTNLGVGRTRYGILLREDGFIFDDGVVARAGHRPISRHHHHGRCRRACSALMEDYPPNGVAAAQGLAGPPPPNSGP